MGVNAFQSEHETIPLLEIDEHVAKHQLQRLKEVKKTRNSSKVKNTLRELKKAAQDDKNLMPYLLDCVREYATLGEIMDTMAEVYGRYQEPITY